MTDTKKTAAKAATETVSETVKAGTKVANSASTALTQAATAYVTGVTALTKSVFGVSKEIAQETVAHGKTSMQANCVRSLAEMQAGYVQHRIESSTVHVKAVADVAGENLKNVYAPLIGLLKDRKAA